MEPAPVRWGILGPGNIARTFTEDVLMLPGDGVREGGKFLPGAYLVESIEHFYTPAEHKGARPCEARLTKAVAHVTSLNPALTA